MERMRVGVGRRDTEHIPEVSTIAKLSQKGNESLLASSLQHDRTSGFRKMLKVIAAIYPSTA